MAHAFDMRQRGGFSHTVAKIRGIAGNTFRESIRQPVVLIILTAAAAMIILSPYTTFFTLAQGHLVVREMGLATMLVAGLLIAAFAASSVVSREIEEHTVLTVLAKPVGRVEFVVGKYLGVLATLLLVGYVLTVVLTLTASVGGFEAGAMQEVRLSVVIPLLSAIGVSFIVAAILNFKKARPFASTAVLVSALAFTAAALLVAFMDYVLPAKGAQIKELQLTIDPSVIMSSILIMMAICVIGSVAVAISTRLNVIMTVVFCAVVFLLGLLSDFLFLPHAGTHTIAWLAYAVVPNFQEFWMGEALTQGMLITLGYVLKAGAYAGFYAAGVLFLGMLLFEDRQVS